MAFDGAVGAIRTAGGGLALGDASTSEVQFYDSTGKRITWIGRSRAAPGARPAKLHWVGRCAGKGLIVAQDVGSGRLTLLTDRGDVVREVTIPRSLLFARPLACPTDDTLLLFHPYATRFRGGSGVVRPRARLVRVRPGVTRAKTLRTFPGTEYFFSEGTKSFIEQPLGSAALATSGDSLLFVGSSEDASIEATDVHGRSQRRIRVDLKRRPATVGDVVSALTMRLYQEPSPASRQLARLTLPQAPLRNSVPRYDALLADKQGNLWLRSFDIPRRDSVRWRVFDGTGKPLAWSDFPTSLYVTEIGPDYVVGIQRQAGEPERVRVYALTKGRPPAGR